MINLRMMDYTDFCTLKLDFLRGCRDWASLLPEYLWCVLGGAG